MIVKITPEGQVTLPAALFKSLKVGPGDNLEFIEGSSGFTLRVKRIDLSKLGTLRGKLDPAIKLFNIHKFRSQGHDRSLRD